MVTEFHRQMGPLSDLVQRARSLAEDLAQRDHQPPPINIVWTDSDLGHFDPDGEVRTMLRGKFFAMMTQAGITDKEAQLEVVDDILGRSRRGEVPYESRADISTTEFARLCQALQDWETIESWTP